MQLWLYFGVIRLTVASFLGIFVCLEGLFDDNSERRHASTKLSARTPLEILSRNFWCNKNFQEKKISPEVLADVYRKFKCSDLVIKPLSHHGYAPTFYSSHECSR